ncbi:hypothetical protein M0802_016632 [Mischocyttarus mexicanus]|nr:hypothetical protein M0802_016632 [Mischocyttarus mexicanus]
MLEENKKKIGELSLYGLAKVYKKSSQNGKITVYLANRDLIVSDAKIDKLQGVLLIDPEYLQDKRVSCF